MLLDAVLEKQTEKKCSWLKENSPIAPTTDNNHDFYLYDGEKLIVGLLGHIQYGWWHGDCLWVNEEYRGQGYASKLMTQAEIYAEDNGLIGIYFETWDFQARPFYEKLMVYCFWRIVRLPIWFYILFYDEEVRELLIKDV